LVKDQIRDVIINPEGYFSQSALLEMATGSGKTFTV
jgi:type I site-specific restriction endonuclease